MRVLSTRSTRSTRSIGRGRRMVVGMAGTVALALAVTGTSAATGAPTDTEPDVDANADAGVDAAADGVYEACSPEFGLGKVVEIVVEVDGEVPTPPLTFPEDVDIVTTWDPGEGVKTCIPEPVTPALWDAETFWGDEFGIPAPEGNYVFLPFADQDDACDATHTLSLVGAPEGYTITVGEAVVPPLEQGLLCAIDEDAAEAAALDAAADVLTEAELAALTAFVTADTGTVEGCEVGTGVGTPSTDLAAAAAALVAALEPPFLALYDEFSSGDSDCEAVLDATYVFWFQTTYHAEVDRQAVFELTTPEPVVLEPTFTG